MTTTGPTNCDTAIWMTWRCPNCQHVNHQHITKIGFGFELDLTANDAKGHVRPWIEADCDMCMVHVEKNLND